jgi:hypothetical protein
MYKVHKDEFSIACYNMYTRQRQSIFTRDKPILSSERMLRKDYNCKGSVAKKNISLVVNLKGLDAEMKHLAINHQSESNFDSDSDCHYELCVR